MQCNHIRSLFLMYCKLAFCNCNYRDICSDWWSCAFDWKSRIKCKL